MTSLLAALIDQHRTPETQAFAAQLFDTDDQMPAQVIQRFGGGYSSVESSFGYAMVEAIGRRAAQALSQGMPIRDVGARMARCLIPFGPSFVTYGLDVFQMAGTTPGLPNMGNFLDTFTLSKDGSNDREILAFSTEAKSLLARGFNTAEGCDQACIHAMVTNLSNYDKYGDFYDLLAHDQTMNAARDPHAPPLLDMVRQVMVDPSEKLAEAVFANGQLPDKMVKEFGERMDMMLANQAGKFAVAEALVNRAIEGLQQGEPLTEVGRRLAVGMKLTVDMEHLTYGMDYLKMVMIHSDHPTLKALCRGKSLSTDAKQQLLDGMKPVLSGPASDWLLDVFTDLDKFQKNHDGVVNDNGMALFRHAVEAVYAAAPSTPAVRESEEAAVKSPVPARSQLKLKAENAERTPDVLVLNDEQMTALYGNAPKDPAFQALSERLVHVAQRQRTQVPDALARFTTLGGMVGLAKDSNGLDVPSTMHLVNQVLAALATDGQVTRNEGRAFMKGLDDAGFLRGELYKTLLTRLMNVKEDGSSKSAPRANFR